MKDISNHWRLIWSHPSVGSLNMAIDEAILEAVAAGKAPPTLRLYAWDPACFSLGYGQPFSDVDENKLTHYGWDIVRRPTGGRAILHTDEITYAVIAPAEHPLMTGGVLPSYQKVSTALLVSLENLSLSAQRKKPATTKTQTAKIVPVCFEMPSHWEITVNNKKLIGSAQMRRKSTVLQHGSIPLFGDLSRITSVLKYPGEKERVASKYNLLKKAVTVEEALGRRVSWGEMASAIEVGFQEAFQINFSKQSLSDWETTIALELENTKYRNTEWTRRRK